MPRYSEENLREILDKDAHIFLYGVNVSIECKEGNLKASLNANLVFPEKPPNYIEGETEDYITLEEVGSIIHQSRYLLYRKITLKMLSGIEDKRTPQTFSNRGTRPISQNPIPRNRNGIEIKLEHQDYRLAAGEHFVYYKLTIKDFIEEDRTLSLGFWHPKL